MSIPASRRARLLALILALPCLAGVSETMVEEPAGLPEAARSAGLVDVVERVPGLLLDVRYATTNNFVGAAVYPGPHCWLQAEVAERLAAVQADLLAQGLSLKVFDCYRPFSVQEHFWTLVADERYVGKPQRDNQGEPLEGSRHNRGAAVDVSLVDIASGEELAMPTDYDDFSERAAADYQALPPAVIANRKVLIDVMTIHGFTVLPSEWWHFDAAGWEQYPLLDIPLR